MSAIGRDIPGYPSNRPQRGLTFSELVHVLAVKAHDKSYSKQINQY